MFTHPPIAPAVEIAASTCREGPSASCNRVIRDVRVAGPAPLTLGRPAGIDPTDNLAWLTPVIQATPLRGRTVFASPAPKAGTSRSQDFPRLRRPIATLSQAQAESGTESG